MPLQKLTFRPGLNREGTDYSNEGGWYDGDKIRFRSGFPEKLGGWVQVATAQFLGVCRSLWNWVSLDGQNNYVGLGTNLKYYIYQNGGYYDITPIRQTDSLGVSPFATSYTTLGANLTANNTTSLTLTSAASFPNSPGVVLIDSEQIYYNSVSGSTLVGLTRGYNGTTAATHTSGAAVGCSVITVTDAGNGATQNDFVTFSGATGPFGGFTAANINAEQEIIAVLSSSSYTFLVPGVFSTSATSGGGSSVTAAYQIFTGLNVYQIGNGWGAGGWGVSPWGAASSTGGVAQQLLLWSNDNFGQDLLIAQRGGAPYYWQQSGGVSTRAVSLKSLANATTLYTTSATFTSGVTTITLANVTNLVDGCYISGTGIPAGTYVTSAYVQGSTSVPISATTTGSSSGTYTVTYSGQYVPTKTNQIIASAIQEFVIMFGANSYNPGVPNTTFDPMLVRWSDQANAYQWVPQLTNQSGEFRLTNGSYIMGARATRQEILVWTDSCLYSMQYLGAPYVWGFNILMDNISVMSPNAMITINNVTYWMGLEKFYMYSGRVETLPCSLRQYIFNDINKDQSYQVFAGANEGFNEVWWFYVSQSNAGTTVDKYVIYNYLDKVWYYGTMARTAWMDSGIPNPIGADYNGRLLYHEVGTDDVATGVALPIDSYVQSSDFDIGDGHNFGFVWRILPDVNFNGSNVVQPSVTMTVRPRENSGTPYGAADNPAVPSYDNYTIKNVYNIQQFDGQVYTRLRGRQLAFRIESNTLGTAWQLGTPRIDIRNDGRR